MENINTQTEVIATYETSRTRRSLVEGNMLNNDSNNDVEYESTGFYVREKSTNDKRSDSNDSSNGLEDNPDASEKSTAKTTNAMNEIDTSGSMNNGTAEGAPLSRDESEVENHQASPVDNDNFENTSNDEDSCSSHNSDKSKSPERKDEEANSNQGTATEDQNDTEENVTELLKQDDAQSAKLDEAPKTDLETEKQNHMKSANIKELSSLDESDRQDVTDSANIDEASNHDESDKQDVMNSSDMEESHPDESGKQEPDLTNDQPKETTANTTTTTENKNGEDSRDAQTAGGKEAEDDSKSTDAQNKDNQDSGEKNAELAADNENENIKSNETSNKDNEGLVATVKDKELTEKSVDVDANSSKEQEVIDVGATKAAKPGDAVDLTIEEDTVSIDLTKKTSKPSKGERSILKGTLERQATGEGTEQDMEMDDDFDPSLLCPDISMDVDEAPVVTNENQTQEDGNVSPLPYEPIFSTLVDEITGAEVQVDLTPAEMELRQQMYGSSNPVQNTKIHCTACNVHLGSAMIGANNRFVHPLLKVLICKNCYHFYTSGEFEKDEDGSELYCRWCGQGGQVLCCSSCEFVFCKRCIRNNFGVKKFKEIRNSDDWNCFRCEPDQLSSLRASCAEFMEYYRTELARAQSLSSKNPELMTTDYTTCCNTPEKKAEAKPQTTPKVRRKRKGEDEDPDYQPIIENEEPPLKKPVPSGGPGYTVITANGPRAILPKLTACPTAPLRPAVPNAAVRQHAPPPSSQVYRVGNTTFRSKTPASVLIQRINANQDVRNSSPGYITIPPSAVKTTTGIYFQNNFTQLRTTTAPVRAQGAYTVVSGANNGNPTNCAVRPAKINQLPVMKHEWFEKTVRAAARVNSNLSYTLTQLNRQQSQASNVEALATVHNKLQEVLSSSINSLIQIRKNLRTEFISGIKSIKFPPKPATKPTTAPIVVNDDDDVIFVNPTSTANPPQVLNVKLPSTIVVSKKSLQKTNPFANPKPSTSGLNAMKITKTVSTSPAIPAPIKGGFLKVRSFTSLQTVPSECITIPDDPPAKKITELEPLNVTLDVDPLAMPVSNEAKSGPVKPDDSKALKPKANHTEVPSVESNLDPPMVFNVKKKHTPFVNEPKSDPVKRDASKASRQKPKDAEINLAGAVLDPLMVFNVKKKPTPVVQKMMNVMVILERSPDVDKLISQTNQRGKCLVVNTKKTETKSCENGAS